MKAVDHASFSITPNAPPTNNLAEQAVRFIVIDRRITQGTRSLKGREICERLWTMNPGLRMPS